MNALAMLERCRAHQPDEGAAPPTEVLNPLPAWREQEWLADPPSAPISCEDYEG